MSNQPLPKISAPIVPAGIVQRERLFRLLDNGREKPIVWISAPGGSGKSTLVSSYLQARRLPAIWYQVDEGDTDLAAFFYYMGLAFQEHVHSVKQPLPLLSPEYLTGIKTFTRQYFEQLFTQLTTPCAVVFDNYQDVPPFSGFHEVLSECFSLIPEGISIILVSRNEPPPLLSLNEESLFGCVGWNDIRLSFEEAVEFALVQTKDTIDSQLLARLYVKSEGWIAGLLLMLESLKESGDACDPLVDISFGNVFDYFADKIIGSSDRESREFLLTTAFVPSITVQMAEQLTGNIGAEQMLSRLARNCFFIDKRTPHYQYHPLFREFLLSRAKLTFTAGEVREIRRKAAWLLGEAGRTEDSAGLLLDAADWDGMTALILKAAPLFLAEGRTETIRAWLDRMPAGLVFAEPYLLYWQGICLMPVDPPKSRSCFRKAFDLFAGKDDRLGQILCWSGGADLSLYEGEFTPMDDWLFLLEGMEVESFAFPSTQIEDRVVMSIFNAMAFRQPHHPHIAKWRERALSLVHTGSDLDFRLHAGIHLVTHHLWNGAFAKASFLMEQIQEITCSGKISPLTDISIKVTQTLHAFFTGADASGVRVALEGLQTADEKGVHVWDSHLMGHGAASALSMGDFTAADAMLEKMGARLEWGRRRFDIGYYHALLAWRKILREDNLATTCHHLEITVDSFHAIGFLAVEAAALNGMADVQRGLGNVEQAHGYLMQAGDIARRIRSSYLEFICLINSILLAMDRHDEVQTVDLLRKAMALGRAGGFCNGWLWRPASLMRVCEKALENGIEADYVRGLIRKRGLIPETPPVHIENWPWPLKIHTLGSFEILRDDKPVAVTGKVKKPLELLKALLAFGGENVSVERLTDVLWADADGDMAQHSFDTTLHRLRKLLGNDKALQLQGGRLSLDPKYCWVDTKAFERQCRRIEEVLAGISQHNNSNLYDWFKEAAGLYKGTFLSGDTIRPWTAPLREHLRSRFLHLIDRAGRHCEDLGNWEKAVSWYQKGLQVDMLTEEFYQRLMICYQQLGQKSRALKTYQSCCTALATGLGLAPSLETEEICRSIRNSVLL